MLIRRQESHEDSSAEPEVGRAKAASVCGGAASAAGPHVVRGPGQTRVSSPRCSHRSNMRIMMHISITPGSNGGAAILRARPTPQANAPRALTSISAAPSMTVLHRGELAGDEDFERSIDARASGWRRGRVSRRARDSVREVFQLEVDPHHAHHEAHASE